MLMVISLNSLFSIFANPGAAAIIYGNAQSEKREERENIPRGSLQIQGLISLNSLFSYLARVLLIVGKVLQNPIACTLLYDCFASSASGVKSNSQPTTCGHTACSLRVGWRVAAAPSNPAEIQRQVTP
jgi:hypothetical protein